MVVMKRDDPTRKFSAALFILLHLTFIPYLRLKYRIRSENRQIFRTVKPPFILLPNHVSLFDPPMVNIFVPHRVHFVMSDANLRTPLARWAYGKLCNVIPKTKALSDSSAVRKIVQLVKKKRVICIFPEGRASWDGVTHNIFFSTVKLLRLLKIPVIVPLIEGGYLSRPRWATSVRSGRLIIRYKIIFDGPELAEMTNEAVYERLIEELAHDDYQFQRRSGQTYPTKIGAEFLERLIFLCPSCKSRATMRSEGNRFFCKSCGFESQWTPEGYLRDVNGSEQRRSVTEWVRRQSDDFDEFLRKRAASAPVAPIFRDPGVTLLVGYRDQPLRALAAGVLSLWDDCFVLENGEQRYEFPIAEISGVQVLLANQFEFYHQNSAYKFKFADPRTSGYKYLLYVQKTAPQSAELD